MDRAGGAFVVIRNRTGAGRPVYVGPLAVEKTMPKVNSGFLEFVRLVVKGEIDAVSRELAGHPAFATAAAEVGATRRDASSFFFSEIAHYLYAGDTALHMAAAAFGWAVAEVLVEHGADWRARNRRGAQPLHYAADTNHFDPAAQARMIEYLLSVGADANALDKSGVGPLHRAVRTRSLAAVRALLDGGANPRAANKGGSTPLHLAVQNTGRGGSGSERAREQQVGIIRLLLEWGARASDKDGRGKRVRDAAGSEWIGRLLDGGLG
ncbi:MAG: ankyrin repeat protein [Phycisphaerales bacterium]|nr:ankyrin repeat protein [Phycisphaerales bacterium]